MGYCDTIFVTRAVNQCAQTDVYIEDYFFEGEASMFDVLRNGRIKAAAATAGTVVIATIIGAGMCAADTPKAKTTNKVTEVSLQNALKVTVEVTFTGDEALKKISPWQSTGDGTRVIGKFPDGTNIKWEAKPKSDQDKNQFTSCKGEKKISGSSATIVMSPDSCSRANAAPKSDANNKTSEKGTDSSSSAPKNSASNTQGNNKTSGNSGDGAGKSIKITFDNTMDNQEGVSLRIWDEAVPGVIQETSMAPAMLNGKSTGHSHTTSATGKKDKSGNYSIDIEFHCGNRGGNVKIKGSASTIQVVKSSNGGCELKKL